MLFIYSLCNQLTNNNMKEIITNIFAAITGYVLVIGFIYFIIKAVYDLHKNGQL